ncbi:FliM/FliN family flagellar motor switch protein [Zooshikella harenae]|uniref:Flagellar motor switch protein FliN n=1 Tax=Zooshikella harenae TaxID=2827238 RepID=A0ABS5ZC83_9GAMM|nr:FliM/FliN family flagellar motor C-terminal domain-containing protein [Zooshikella harenae]MBU2711668.1 FliM/FliN family flagellar motor switch protein [Zooshikella harenae]
MKHESIDLTEVNYTDNDIPSPKETLFNKIQPSIIENLNISIEAELGSTEMSVSDFFNLKKNDVVILNTLIDQPLDLKVNGQTIATGELVVVNNNYGIRITHILENNI